LIGATIAEHYTIDTLIGEGAMGRVYRALAGSEQALRAEDPDRRSRGLGAMRIGSQRAENASRLIIPTSSASSTSDAHRPASCTW
jgi:hypothetical protein